MTHEYLFYIGVDWGWTEHQVYVSDCTSDRAVNEFKIKHDGKALEEMIQRLRRLSDDPQRVAVAIELTHGAVVETLLDAGFHVYSVNPKQVDRFRDRFTVAGSKDDRLDAKVLASSLRTDRSIFRRLQSDEPGILKLRGLVRADTELRDEFVRLVNQLTEQLRRYFPQYLEFGSLADQPWLWALLQLVPTPEAARRIRAREVDKLLKERRIRRLTARKTLRILRKKPLVLAPGAAEAAETHVALLLPRLELVYGQRVDCERRMKLLLKELELGSESASTDADRREHRDAEILLSLPGLGTRTAATMLAEATQPLADRAYRILRSYGGVSPVLKQSGKHAVVTMRRACNGRLRDALHHMARGAIQRDELTNKHYQRLRERGHSHARALRTVADRLLKILCAMLRTGTLYDPVRLARPAGATA